jgi:hypothetical protein
MFLASVSSFLASIPLWGWLDILFTLIVLLGVWMESAKIAKFFVRIFVPENLLGREMVVDSKYESLKYTGGILVVLGIAGEVVCLAFSLNDSASLNDKAQKASERAALVESNNLTLRSNVASLEKAVFQLARQYDMSTNALAEAKARIGALSDAVVLNSPSNFPISSVSGNGYIVINKNDASLVVGLENKRAFLEFMSEPPTNSLIRNPLFFGGLIVEGIIRGVSTNRFGNPEVSFDFEESNLRQAGPAPKITFNNVAFVRLDICPKADALGVEKGFLNLELNSEFEFSVEFKFPPQTNSMISIFGIKEKDPFR